MYREALAAVVHQHGPDLEVRIAPPEDVEVEVGHFSPHLLVHNDTDELEPGLLSHLLGWIEILYSDSMDAKVCSDGQVSEVSDISIDGLLTVVDEVEAVIRP
jgi:hypothetical protein